MPCVHPISSSNSSFRILSITKLFPVPGPPCNIHTRGCVFARLWSALAPPAESPNSCANTRSATFWTTLR
eukprot:2419137-Pyramimonas_sp.AAC.1